MHFGSTMRLRLHRIELSLGRKMLIMEIVQQMHICDLSITDRIFGYESEDGGLIPAGPAIVGRMIK